MRAGWPLVALRCGIVRGRACVARRSVLACACWSGECRAAARSLREAAVAGQRLQFQSESCGVCWDGCSVLVSSPQRSLASVCSVAAVSAGCPPSTLFLIPRVEGVIASRCGGCCILASERCAAATCARCCCCHSATALLLCAADTGSLQLLSGLVCVLCAAAIACAHQLPLAFACHVSIAYLRQLALRTACRHLKAALSLIPLKPRRRAAAAASVALCRHIFVGAAHGGLQHRHSFPTTPQVSSCSSQISLFLLPRASLAACRSRCTRLPPQPLRWQRRLRPQLPLLDLDLLLLP